MNRKESNRLILDFMGVKPLSTGNVHSWSDSPYYYTTEDTFEKVMDNICNYAKYDTSWDWLMKVVEKIDRLNRLSEDEEMSEMVLMATGEPLYTPIHTAYNNCVQFIQWYNSSQIKNN